MTHYTVQFNSAIPAKQS